MTVYPVYVLDLLDIGRRQSDYRASRVLSCDSCLFFLRLNGPVNCVAVGSYQKPRLIFQVRLNFRSQMRIFVTHQMDLDTNAPVNQCLQQDVADTASVLP